jgi:hypothetical protein
MSWLPILYQKKKRAKDEEKEMMRRKERTTRGGGVERGPGSDNSMTTNEYNKRDIPSPKL